MSAPQQPDFNTPLDQPKPPTTTLQQDITLAGQRKVNLIWEYTQAIVAVMLVAAFIITEIRIVFDGKVGQEVPAVLAALCGTVVGSYFQRTNHMNVGGVGPKAPDYQTYVGRALFWIAMLGMSRLLWK